MEDELFQCVVLCFKIVNRTRDDGKSILAEMPPFEIIFAISNEGVESLKQ